MVCSASWGQCPFRKLSMLFPHNSVLEEGELKQTTSWSSRLMNWFNRRILVCSSDDSSHKCRVSTSRFVNISPVVSTIKKQWFTFQVVDLCAPKWQWAYNWCVRSRERGSKSLINNLEEGNNWSEYGTKAERSVYFRGILESRNSESWWG